MIGQLMTDLGTLGSRRRWVYPRAVRLRSGLLVFLAACAPSGDAYVPVIEEPPPLARTGSAWSDCYRSFQPSADPESDLDRLAAACAGAAGMRALTPVHEGVEQGRRDPPERLHFRARRGHCYRAFAVGAPGVEDLDLAVYDARGQLTAADVSRDRWPVVPPLGPACAEEDGLFTIAVAVRRGRGPFVLQVWGSDRDAIHP